ncbi:outer membrane beta-barrel family protein [Sphingobacterium sp. BN32]|uniref:outer membrane beta-barrel family protein n=1 Tax=Sphingobacterium sp. BN32 TaxID=3058432 RepID=UPI00265D4429|nr:outer membrane beta-barrel family protein [Sphingobacterium sp. BN32]WKK57004.1 outer membrane beta-barrel family protein [Sphingobacterium sp. BN32]
MQFHFTLLAVLLFISTLCIGQSLSGIKGIVLNEFREALDQVSIRIEQVDSSTVTLSSDAKGQFSQKLPAGRYEIRFSYLGHSEATRHDIVVADRVIDLGEIILKAQANRIDAVAITGTRRLIEQKSDRMVINVENSLLSDGLTALEILQRAPGVKVDDDGNISMRGKADVGVMINGKLSYLSKKELATLLQGTSSSSLKSVELISNPSAKFDASGMGGMINIVLKDGKKPGFNFAINSFGGGGRKERYGAGINFNKQEKAFNIYGSYDYAYRGEEEYRNFDRYYAQLGIAGGSAVSNQYSLTDEPLNTNNAKVGFDYHPLINTQLGLLWSGNFGTYKNRNAGYKNVFETSASPISNALTYNDNVSRWNTNNINFNIQQKIGAKEHVLSADVDYMYADYDADQALNTYYQQTDYEQAFVSMRKNQTPSVSKLTVGKVDYLHHLSNKQRFEIGWKSSWMNSDNNAINDTLQVADWVSDLGTSNHFLFEEQIHAGYLNYHLESGSWTLMAGLRAEHTNAVGNQLTSNSVNKREYTNLFPSGSLGYRINDNHQFQFSYSRRINRPDYEDLNPFRHFVDASIFWEGNPLLQPELAHNFELNYSFLKDLHLSLFYTDVKDVMTSVLTQLPEQQVTIRSLHNIEGYRNKGVNLNYSFSPIKSFSSINNITVHENYFFGSFREEKIDNRQWSVNLLSTNTLNLPKQWSFELIAAYQSPQSDGVFKQKSSGHVSAGVMKRLLDNKLNLKFAANDIFKTRRYQTESFSGNVRMNQYINLDSRTFLLSLSYKIGTNGKAFDRLNKKSEEQSRIRGGS